MRLDKYLCDMGYGTRSSIKRDIRNKAVTVNGRAASGPEMKVEPQKDEVSYNGEIISYSLYEYYMFYKPSGCITATEDGRNKTVMDYMTDLHRKGLFPVGRLDKDTEGLLLITNDGMLAHRLLAPGKHVPKSYYAKVEGRISDDAADKFAEGLDIGDEKMTLPAKLDILKEDAYSEIIVTITEGRYHQVKRMVEAVGGKVIYLKRLSMGSLVLDDELKPGEYRRLEQNEIDMLINNHEG